MALLIVAFALAQNRIELETIYKLSPDGEDGGVADGHNRGQRRIGWQTIVGARMCCTFDQSFIQ